MYLPSSLRRSAALMLTTIAVSLSLIGGLRPARGEETGLSFRLSYVRGYSTWGPTNVYGKVHVWPVDGEVALEVHDLPRLPGKERYRAWIVGTTQQVMELGSFNTTDAGNGSLDVIFNRRLPQGANAVVITVAAAGDSSLRPGTERTLVGFFPTAAGVPAELPSAAQPARHGTPGLLVAHPQSRPGSPARSTPRGSSARSTAKTAHTLAIHLV